MQSWPHHTLNSGTPGSDATSSPGFAAEFLCVLFCPLSKCNFPTQPAARDNQGGRFSAFRTLLPLRFPMICRCCSWINYSANERVPGACHKSSVGAGQAFLTFPALLSGTAPAAPLAGKQTNPQPSWLGTCWNGRKIQYCHSRSMGHCSGQYCLFILHKTLFTVIFQYLSLIFYSLVLL